MLLDILSLVCLAIHNTLSTCYRDRGDHSKVVGLKNLATTNKHLGQCFAIYLAFARYLEP